MHDIFIGRNVLFSLSLLNFSFSSRLFSFYFFCFFCVFLDDALLSKHPVKQTAQHCPYNCGTFFRNACILSH
ncbi:hypothetical protein CW304_18805 [Bacillus sp. UFRGS-B20]|nr:hypothetical protein CW304_18805 [Bacillus sp. UFRGS-B20]